MERFRGENSGQEFQVTDDKKTFKTMASGFVLICLCCSVMHYILVTKGNMYIQRAKPRYNLEKKDTTGKMREGVGTVVGLVSAASFDKFYLVLPDGKTQTFLLGELAAPEAGERLTVTYTGGDPPKALMLESAKPRSER